MLASQDMVILKEDDKGIAAVSQKKGIKELSFPGFVLHTCFGPDSDILVEFKPGLFSWAPERMENNFSRLLGGRINRVTDRSPGRHIREGAPKRGVKRFRADQLIIQSVDKPAGLFPRKGMEKGLSPPAEKY